MTAMEFILVAFSIIVGFAISEILGGISELVRSNIVKISYRLLLITVWTLLLLLQLWWSVWHLSHHAVWTFLQFILFLVPVGILSVIARLCFPAELNGADLDAYYASVSRAIWWLVAAIYAAFGFLLAPFTYGVINPAVFASQIGIAGLALVASRVESPYFQVLVIILMLAQVAWRGASYTIGS